MKKLFNININLNLNLTLNIVLLSLLLLVTAYPQSELLLLMGKKKDVTSPAAPTSLFVGGLQNKDSLTWTDPTALDFDSVRIYRETWYGSGVYSWQYSVAKGVQVKIDSALTPDSVYRYKLYAKDYSGNISTASSTAFDTVKPILYAIDLDGSTEHASKTSPVNLDLNGAEMVVKDSNSTFESADTTDWASNGTHSIDTSSTYKYAGSYSGKVVSVAGSNPYSSLNFTSGWTTSSATIIDADSFTTAGTGGVYQATISGITTGDYVKFTIAGTTTSSNLAVYNAGVSQTFVTGLTGTFNTTIYATLTNIGIYIRNNGAGNTIITTLSMQKLNGDTTTNFISLAYTQFGQIEAGKKYTVEYWVNAASPGDWASTTKPRYTLKIGSKSSQSDTIYVYPGLWEKVVYNFQATSAEVNTPIKIYCNQADTGWIDNFSITPAKDLMVNVWAALTDTANSYYSFVATSTSSNAFMHGIITTGYTKPYSELQDGSKNPTYLKGISSILAGNYYLFTYYFDRVTNAVTFYKNGVSQGTATSTRVIGKLTLGSNAFWLGRFWGGYSKSKIGETQITTFDDISTLDKTPAQIYYRSKTGFYFPTSYTGGTIIASYRWIPTDNTVLMNDESASNNDLTGTNLTTSDSVLLLGY